MSRDYGLWHRLVYRLVPILYFARITVTHRERLPRNGPVLFLALHRNGALDGLVYYQALRGPIFMISTQLRRNWFARLFFTGIAVKRTKDEGEQQTNNDALQACTQVLRRGGKLCIFPEGTSTLGPRHLPFKSGAAWLVMNCLDQGGTPPQVVPVGIHYQCPWAFRARVEVVVGTPIAVDLPANLSARERLRILRTRMQAGLEAVGINVPTAQYQETIQQLAYASTLATPRSYFKSLKALEREMPVPIRQAGEKLQPELNRAKLWYHQGVPLFPMGSAGLYCLALLLLAPLTATGILLNLPPYLAGWYAGRKFPDDRNVISLWKLLVGAPVLCLWLVAVTVSCLALGRPLWLFAYAGLSWLALVMYYRVKKLAVAVHNVLVCPHLRKQVLNFRDTVLQNLPAEAVEE